MPFLAPSHDRPGELDLGRMHFESACEPRRHLSGTIATQYPRNASLTTFDVRNFLALHHARDASRRLTIECYVDECDLWGTYRSRHSGRCCVGHEETTGRCGHRYEEVFRIVDPSQTLEAITGWCGDRGRSRARVRRKGRDTFVDVMAWANPWPMWREAGGRGRVCGDE